MSGVFSSISISRYFPIRTLRTSGIPRCCIASRTAAPWGSSTAAFGVTTTLTFMPKYPELDRDGQAQCSSTRRSGFAHYFGWFLVLPQAQENRLTQLPVAGPFGELHLANKNRINPFAS